MPALKYGDKFTKKPLLWESSLVLFGRLHIQTFDLGTFQSGVLISRGEDDAERIGEYIQQNRKYLEER